MLSSGYSFELTPLSGLITQSFTDISLLRRLAETQSPTYPSPAYSPTMKNEKAFQRRGTKGNNTSAKTKAKAKGNSSRQVQQSLIDFDKVEDNLKKLEELYRQFLNYGGKFGDKAEEVHLVAVVCKRSDVVKGQMGVGDGYVLLRVSHFPC
jgi:flagellar motility protein MotE (MotC chaperone)